MNTRFLSRTTAVAVCCVAVFGFVSCDDDDNSPVLRFAPAKVQVVKDNTANVTVENGTAPYTATSSNGDVAIVAVDGNTIIITGVNEGVASVTVTDKNKMEGRIPVQVNSGDNTILFDKDDVGVSVGSVDVVTVENGTAPYAATSGNVEIATVAVDGDKVTVEGVKAGATTVTVADKDGKTGTFAVTVE